MAGGRQGGREAGREGGRKAGREGGRESVIKLARRPSTDLQLLIVTCDL